MKVGFVSTYPPEPCGIAIYSGHLVKSLEKCCDVEVFPLDRPVWNPLYFVRLARQARKGADLIHVQYDAGFFGTLGRGRLSLSGMYTPLFYAVARALGGPPVVTTVHELHDARKDYGGRWLYWPMYCYYAAIYFAMAALSDAVIVHTTGTVDTLAQYFRLKNAEVIPLALYVEPDIRPPAEARTRLGLAGKSVVLMFGFISEPKGHDLALAALEGLPEDVVLYIAGDARTEEGIEYVKKLKETVKARGLDNRVIFHGYLSDEAAPEVISAAHVVLLPYRHVVQSAALGYVLAYLKPVLASDIGGFAEVARTHGCLEVFPAGDVGALRRQLAAMLDDPARLTALAAAAGRYREETSLDKVTARTCELYRRLLKK